MSDDNLAKAVEPAHRWIAPDVGDGLALARPELMTAHRLEALQEAAQKEGFASGFKEGRQAGLEELNHLTLKLNELVGLLDEPLKRLDDDVERALVGLAMQAAQQIIRRELKADPKQIIGVVHQVVELLPINSRSVAVHLHPQDAAIVRHAYQEGGTQLAWELIDDPVLTRGGLRVTTETSEIDARIEHRMDTMLANLIGGDREYDG